MSAVDEVKARLDVVDVIGDRVNLQKAGRAFKAVCPFHNEKTPSFYVFPERQTWRCFGACSEGGDVFNFIMKQDGLSFPEALRKLAERAGVTLPQTDTRDADALVAANEAARELFQKNLASTVGASAKEYLLKRKLDEQTIDLFQLGLAPRSGDALVKHLLGQGFTGEQLQAAGLAGMREGGRLRDQFFGRLMFPIRDSDGKLAGFGGRTMDGSEPKYLNSPRTRLFDKSSILYGLNFAKTEARRQRRIVVVEGYMDAIAAHQHRYSNVVASMGIAITEQQAVHLRGVADTVVLALDPDAAGQEATVRRLEEARRSFLERRSVVTQARGTTLFSAPQGPEFKVALLPNGQDPDEVIQADPKEWERLIDQAVPFVDYLLDAMVAKMDVSTPAGKAKAVELLFPLIAAAPDAFQQDHYFSRLAKAVGVTEASLEASVGRPKAVVPKQGPQRRQASASPFEQAAHDPLEEHALALLVQNPDMFPEATALAAEHFHRPENRALFDSWRALDIISLGDSVDSSLRQHVATLAAYPLPPSDRRMREAELRECVRRLEERRLRLLKAEASLRLAETNMADFESQQDEVLAITERMRDLYRSRDQGRKGDH